MNHCLRHFEEPVVATCRECHHPFCSRCLVYSFGPKKPPYCVGCALHASGIRTGSRVVPPLEAATVVPADGPAPLDKRTERALKRAERDAGKQAAKAAKRAARKGAPALAAPQATMVGVARVEQIPAPSELLAHEPAWSSQL